MQLTVLALLSDYDLMPCCYESAKLSFIVELQLQLQLQWTFMKRSGLVHLQQTTWAELQLLFVLKRQQTGLSASSQTLSDLHVTLRCLDRPTITTAFKSQGKSYPLSAPCHQWASAMPWIRTRLHSPPHRTLVWPESSLHSSESSLLHASLGPTPVFP